MHKKFYQLIYDEMLERIKRGEFDDGSKMPTEFELAESYDVSRITSKRALDMLAADGYIVRVPGRGTFISNEGSGVVERSVKRSQTRLIGIIFSRFDERYGLELFQTLYAELYGRGYSVIFRFSEADQGREIRHINELIKTGVEGLIVQPVASEEHNPELIRLAMARFPLVLLDRGLEGVSLPGAGTDFAAMGRLAAEHLIALGHANIGFISQAPNLGSAAARLSEGFKDAHLAANLACDFQNIFTELADPAADRARAAGQLGEYLKRNVTAVVVAEFEAAILLSDVLVTEGRVVPEELSIVTFDAQKPYFNFPYYTFMKQREREIALAAAGLLFEVLDDKRVSDFVKTGADLILGRTTGKNLSGNT